VQVDDGETRVRLVADEQELAVVVAALFRKRGMMRVGPREVVAGALERLGLKRRLKRLLRG